MLGWQVGAKFDFPHIFYFQLAPTLYNYTGDGNTFNIHFSGDPGGNQTGINSLLVLDIPAEIGWKVWKIPMRIFGDFATNFEATSELTLQGILAKGTSVMRLRLVSGVGELKKRGDWQIQALVPISTAVCAGSEPDRLRLFQSNAEPARPRCASRVHAV